MVATWPDGLMHNASTTEQTIMKKSHSRALARSVASALVVAGGLALAAGAASAGECPADKVTTDGQKPGAKAHSQVTDKVIASIDLGKEAPRLKDHKFRLRRLVIQPGGEVAWHSHEERPAIIYIVSGSVTEYASTCAVPIVHKAGEVAAETHATAHWWKNTSNKPAILLSADILHDRVDPKTM
jgi:quercetin dioxygenase-like cupin family protein